MAQLPRMTLVEKINAVSNTSYSRGHLGASQIGASCVRSLVYDFFWADKRRIDGKLNRIFSLGDHVEEVIIESLETIGIKHYGGQDRVVGFMGHAGGSIDGIVDNVPGFDEELLFEAKSMNHNNFLDVKRKGVQESKPVYYSQMQMYMGRLELNFGLFVSLDKNTSDLYTEILPFDEEHYEILVERERNVISADHIDEFPKIGTNPSWFACKFCDYREVCHGNQEIARNCRTCEHAGMGSKGTWMCTKSGMVELSIPEQTEGCDRYVQDDMWRIKL